jgi:glycyl-tRNA synthetase (class II)
LGPGDTEWIPADNGDRGVVKTEYFIPPDEHLWEGFHQEWIDRSWEWLKSIGLREDLMGKDVHDKNDLAHYARACTDIVFKFPFGETFSVRRPLCLLCRA